MEKKDGIGENESKKWPGFSDEWSLFGVNKMMRTSWKGYFPCRQLPGQIWKEIALAGNKKNGILNVLWYLYGSLALSGLDTDQENEFLPNPADGQRLINGGEVNDRTTGHQTTEKPIVANNDKKQLMANRI